MTFGTLAASSNTFGFAIYQDSANGLELTGQPSPILGGPVAGRLVQDGNGWLLFHNAVIGAIFSLQDPGNSADFVFGWDRPGFGNPASMSVSSGFIFDISDGAMSIRTYGFSDSGGQAPILSGSIPEIDADPSRTGIQLTPGMTVRPRIAVTDAQGVRKVRFLVDGVSVHERTYGPWNMAWTVPSELVNRQAQLQIEAFDFSGNRSLLDLGAIDVVADTLGPRIYTTTPAAFTTAPTALRTFGMTFNESVTLQADAITLRRTSDTAVIASTLAVSNETVTLQFHELAPGVYDVVVDGTKITDAVGNTGQSLVMQFTIEPRTVRESIYWATGRTPGHLC